VVIKRSSARDVAALLHDLQAGDDVARETAAARLSVIGTRAVPGLVEVAVSQAPPRVRAAALAALESIGDARAIDPAAGVLEAGDPGLTEAAAGVLRAALNSPRGAEALDRLASVALDAARPAPARLAALAALKDLPERVVGPVWQALAADASPAIRAIVAPSGRSPILPPAEAIEAASGGTLPDDPEALRHWLASDAARVPLPILHRLVEVLRAREADSPDPARRSGWMTARASAHLALAQRGSRVALYDLRETIASATSAPVEMLTALEVIGDRSCLEPIAAAYARLSAEPPSATAWWREHLASAFRTIAGREKLTERHAVTRQIRARWPAAASELIGPPRR
jgi:hypothetical protein